MKRKIRNGIIENRGNAVVMQTETYARSGYYLDRGMDTVYNFINIKKL